MLKSVMDNLQLLNRNELIQLEPILKDAEENIFGAIYCPSDESGSCRDFTIELTKICKQKGGKFYFKTTVKDFKIQNDKIDKITFSNDAVSLLSETLSVPREEMASYAHESSLS